MGNLGRLKKSGINKVSMCRHKILSSLREKEFLLMSDLEQMPEGRGNFIAGNHNKKKIYWNKLSKDMANAFLSLLADQQIEAYPCNVAIYVERGEYLALETETDWLGRTILGPTWAPVVRAIPPCKSVDKECEDFMFLPLVITKPNYINEDNRQRLTGFEPHEGLVEPD